MLKSESSEDLMFQSKSNEELVPLILDGQKELFAVIMERNSPRLYRVIRTYVHGNDDVKDIIQNTYLLAFKNLSHFRKESLFSTWLIRIAINESLKFIKEQKKVISIDDNKSAEFSQPVLPFYTNPEKRILLSETKSYIQHAIDQLPDKYKLIYILREVEGLPDAEIAECLHISEDNINVRLFRAKKILKEELLKLASGISIYEMYRDHHEHIRKHVSENI